LSKGALVAVDGEDWVVQFLFCVLQLERLWGLARDVLRSGTVRRRPGYMSNSPAIKARIAASGGHDLVFEAVEIGPRPGRNIGVRATVIRSLARIEKLKAR